jgi:hypothetical protein
VTYLKCGKVLCKSHPLRANCACPSADTTSLQKLRQDPATSEGVGGGIIRRQYGLVMSGQVFHAERLMRFQETFSGFCQSAGPSSRLKFRIHLFRIEEAFDIFRVRFVASLARPVLFRIPSRALGTEPFRTSGSAVLSTRERARMRRDSRSITIYPGFCQPPVTRCTIYFGLLM